MTPQIRTRLLYGTDEPPAEPRVLRAGALSAELHGGNLRYIRMDGSEALRAISFLVRDPNWATYEPEIDGLRIDERPESFHVTYRATVRDGVAALEYVARIEGEARGTLSFTCDMHALTDFETCRAGFVVLHPAGAAGRAARIEHADGRVLDGAFPALIDPVQPMLDLRAITHDAAPGLAVTCRMEGDVFEMEDQRNWTDASFKTYVRPLSRPWPYTLAQGSTSAQSVALTIERDARAAAPEDAGGPVRIEPGAVIGRMPRIGLGCRPDEARAALPHADLLARSGVDLLVCRFDPGLGHATADLRLFADLARAASCEVELQLVVHSVTGFAAELHDAACSVADAGLLPRAIAVSPAPDLKSTTPGQPWPACAPLDQLYQAARAAFPGIPLIGGTFAYFTELNRKRPPTSLLDAVCFSTSPLVHTADDRSVMESLEALPAVSASVRAIAGGKPVVIGPSAIGMRDNPYGATPLANPRAARLPMSGADPRQRGLFNAAWTLGYIARFAAGGAARIAVSAPAGPHGIMEGGTAFPVFSVIRGLAALRGASLHAVRVSREDAVTALLASSGEARALWLANLTPAEQTVALPPMFAGAALHVLDAESLHAAAAAEEVFQIAPVRSGNEVVVLGPYAVLRCHAGATD